MYRIMYQKVFDGTRLLEPDLPRVLVEELKTPFDVIRNLNGLFEHCIEDTHSLIPNDECPRKFGMLRGNTGCRCKVFVEKY